MGFKHRVDLFLKLQINEFDENWINESNEGENGAKVIEHEIVLLSIVDEIGRLNKHEIPLFSKVDSHNIDSDVVNRGGLVMDTHFGYVPKTKNKNPKLDRD